MGRLRSLAILFAAIMLLHADAFEQAGVSSSNGASLTTSDRLQAAGWWPTKGDAERSQYAGDEACAQCHTSIAKLQQTTPMHHASVRAGESEILRRSSLEFHEANLHYAVTSSPAAVTYHVDDGTDSLAAETAWVFGAGEIGQTFLLRQDSTYIESRVSYFTRLGALDITIGHSPRLPADKQSALGHAMDAGVAQRCFSCHTTEAVTASVFDPEQAIAGVRCEACHGPGVRHVEAMKAGQFKQASTTIVNPAHLAPVDSVDFCGACHRTWADVVMQSPTGIGMNTVRFQPYLLENSRCWGKSGDPRLTCIACHDPHQPLQRDATAYDAKCLSCHAQTQQARSFHGAKTVCRTATRQCTTCHMPKYELPQSHASFTDHTIRIVSAASK